MNFDYLPTLGTSIKDLDTPALLLDLDIVEENILKMQNQVLR